MGVARASLLGERAQVGVNERYRNSGRVGRCLSAQRAFELSNLDRLVGGGAARAKARHDRLATRANRQPGSRAGGENGQCLGHRGTGVLFSGRSRLARAMPCRRRGRRTHSRPSQSVSRYLP
jgi:hypothetical protein